MTLSAVDAVHRGLVNLRANWELLFIQILQVLIVTVLVLIGFVPPLGVLGFGDLELLDPATQDWVAVADSAATLVARGREAWALLLASLALSCAIWLMGMLVYCYFQGGIFGVLVAGDRQAPRGKPRSRVWFRTFSIGSLRGWAARYLWRYFWLLNLFVVISTVWLSFVFLLLSLTFWGEAKWGPAAALGIGCGGAVPLIFSLIVLAFWVQLAQADLAREDSGVWTATRRGIQILGRRLGAVLLLGLLLIFIWIGLTAFVAFVSAFIDLFSGFGATMRWTGHIGLTVVEWGVSGVVSVAFAAIMVALVRSESPTEVPA